MSVNVAKEVAALRKLTMRELRGRYAEAFGETTNANNKAWLLKRIVWRLQANAEGDLSERARRRAAELANDADLRLAPPKPKEPPEVRTRDRAASLNTGGTVCRRRGRQSRGTTMAKRCGSPSWPTASSSRATATSRSRRWPRRSPDST